MTNIPQPRKVTAIVCARCGAPAATGCACSALYGDSWWVIRHEGDDQLPLGTDPLTALARKIRILDLEPKSTGYGPLISLPGWLNRFRARRRDARQAGTTWWRVELRELRQLPRSLREFWGR